MKFSFNKRAIETFCTSLSFFLVVVMTFLCLLAIVDGVFNWDLLPPSLENIVLLIMCSMGLVIGSCALINLIINLSLISRSLETMAKNFELKVKDDE